MHSAQRFRPLAQRCAQLRSAAGFPIKGLWGFVPDLGKPETQTPHLETFPTNPPKGFPSLSYSVSK